MATRYLARFMVHPAPGKVRNTTAVIAPDITAFFYATALTFTAEGEMRLGTFTLSPPAPAKSFLGVWCVGIWGGGEQAPITSQLAILAGK